ncbi:DHA1 family tetracycline resistance protein-like MFS transporter [Planktotalea frisia]|jgi:DHA1 family tetracycline resistance protein-like MFS transporter|uniref:Tetracycline resistance protein, class C n=1 Tax=Planktotalea frisia TaxID=696762 RepID=A0A1L9P1P4_9RHOB|nr:TCR/Tet family MFS transporter [Planktotalea frisia]OJI95480.1 tetracycline resistance protein, class C [Planktotalea frisia]PZX32678.1 DHA1 family tetracycline resistance protein-like MFS transporter [Planktotalea frisia]
MSPRLPIIFVVATVAIDAMGIGLIMPVMPDLLREVDGGNLSDAAIWGGILATTFAAMQFLFGPVVGSLSDRYGRKPILVFSLVIMAFDYVLMAFAGTIWLLLIGRIIGGITASTHATAAAYIADVSKPEEKAANFGLIGAGFGIGFVFGPVIGGLLAEFGTRAPFWAAAVLALSNAIFGWYVLKESVTDANRRAFDWKRANPFGAFKSIGSFPGLGALLLVYFFYQVSSVVYPAVWSFFTAERFAWSPGTIGLSLAIFGISFALVQGLLVAPSIKLMGHRKTVIVGLILEAAALALIAVIWSGNVLLWCIPFAALGAIGMPALQGIMSRRVSDDAQGELQGVLTSVNSLAAIIAPLVLTRSFAYFTEPDAPIYLPGAPFIIAAVLMLISVVIFQMRKRSSATS